MAGDYIAEALDKEKGSSVTDASIFRAHAAKYEVSLGIWALCRCIPAWGGNVSKQEQPCYALWSDLVLGKDWVFQ